MTNGRRIRISFCLLAGALFGAPTLLLGFSAAANARHYHRVHSMHFAPANNSTPASNQNALNGGQKSDEHVAPNPATPPEGANDDKQLHGRSVGNGQGGNESIPGGKNTNAGEKNNTSPDMKDLGPVDASNTIVRPRFQGTKAATRVGASKISSKTGKLFHPRHAFVQHKNRPVVRNTIGVPIAPHDLTAGQRVGPAGVPKDVKAGAGDGVVKPSPAVGSAGVFHPNAGTGLPPSNRGVINGTGFSRRGFVPAALGGQTKMTGALNGSMIRPKY
jgi:hypothetical protein